MANLLSIDIDGIRGRGAGAIDGVAWHVGIIARVAYAWRQHDRGLTGGDGVAADGDVARHGSGAGDDLIGANDEVAAIRAGGLIVWMSDRRVAGGAEPAES